ncbi:MAG TPA: hypothetical protein VJQ49_03465 [Casimicrobiaceae bacterium]|nr:hypothetical protein [Casimicrobiaceae bacterium]
MTYVTLAAGLALPWLLGLTVLFALGWPRPGDGADGANALRAGFGFCIGALLLTLWMRVLSSVGIAFGWLSIGLPIAAATVALWLFASRSGRIGRLDARAMASALLRPALPRWQRLLWLGLLAWLALRFLLLAADVAWQPLYPWDAWVQWATKSRVWYELGHMAPFVRGEQWLASPGGVYFDAAPNYPATVPLWQVWSCIALGRWDDSAMNWPWLLLLIALVAAVYGMLRGEGLAPLTALIGAYLVASLPLLDTHAALAGYADLPMAAIYTLAALAFYRWAMRRDWRDAAVAIFLALCCPLIKIPGLVWALTLLPGVVVALAPRRGLKIVGIAYALGVLALLALARTQVVILGYRLHADFTPGWRSFWDAYLLSSSWNLLWYAAVVLAIVGAKRLTTPRLAPLAVVVGTGVAFVLFVTWFTNASAWMLELTTLNRASLHLAPLVVVLGVLLWRELTTAAQPGADRALAPA